MTAPKVTDPFAECVATWCQGLLPFHPSFSLLESLAISWVHGDFLVFPKITRTGESIGTIIRFFNPSSVIPPHIFPRAKAVLRRVEGEFHFALPLRLLGAVLLVPPLLGSGEVLVPVPPVCCGKQLAAFGF